MEGVEVERPLKLHFIPYPASGHMMPLCDIATLFASRGQHVTIITTPVNAQSLTKTLSSATLRLHTVDFPYQQVDLPKGVESLTSTTDPITTWKIHDGAMLLNEPVGDFVEKNPPDCIIADSAFSWANDLAHKLQIPNLTFNGSSLFVVSIFHSLRSNNLLQTNDDNI